MARRSWDLELEEAKNECRAEGEEYEAERGARAAARCYRAFAVFFRWLRRGAGKGNAIIPAVDHQPGKMMKVEFYFPLE